MMDIRLKWLLFLVAGALIGCSLFQKKGKTHQQPLIALLPFESESVVLDAPDHVRNALFKAMTKKKYRLMELKTIDATLIKMGILEGGQLGALSLEQIQNEIPADWFCYGNVVAFGFKSAIAISQREVEVELKVVEGGTGRIIHEDSQRKSRTQLGGAALGDLTYTAVGKVFKSVKDGIKKVVPGKPLKKVLDSTDKIADVELTRETRKVVKKLLKRFPKN